MLDNLLPTNTLLAFLLLPFIIAITALTRILNSPLRHVPAAHPLARLTSKWILWRRFLHQENATIKAAHAKHGPVVLLGPGEVSVNCVKGGLSTVYSGGFEKPGVGEGEWGFYTVFDNYGVPCMFSTSHSRPHSQRKRMLSNIYSKSLIQSSTDLRARTTRIIHERLFPVLASISSGTPPACSTPAAHFAYYAKGGRDEGEVKAKPTNTFDAYLLLNALTMDIVTSYIFGLRSSAGFLCDVEKCKWFLGVYNSRHGFSFWNHETPNFLKWMEKLRLDTLLIPSFVDDANAGTQSWTMDMVQKAKAVIQSEENGESTPMEDTPIVLAQLLSALRVEAAKDPSSKLHDETHLDLTIASELLDHHAAGFDTSGITLTYLVWELSLPKNAHIQKSLREELRTLNPTFPASTSASKPPKIPSAKALDSLPLLQAILQETLRLHSAIPGPQPREVPAQGCFVGPGVSASTSSPNPKPSTNANTAISRTSAHYFIPSKTRISASAGILHSNADIFPSPDIWQPSRWLLATPTQRKEMDRWFWAFGSGGRMCVGRNLAIYQMKMVVAALYMEYRTWLVDDEGMEQVDAYTAGPRRRRLGVGIERVV